MKASFPSLAGSRAGLCDFVPAEDRLFSFGVRHNPQVQRLAAALRKAGIESLLDPARFLALTVLIRHAAKSSPADFIELGVYKGGSAALTALVLRATELVRPLHLCDTFAGMPKTLDWEFHKEFDFADTSLESVSTRLAKLDSGFPFHFHRGLFSQTLPALADRRFCFAHVDADLYESVLQACQFVYPRMAKGGFILFDDYGASTCPGAKRAVDEFFADKLENPTHVASCAYGIRIGQETTDFHRLVSLQGFPSALVNAAYTAPRRALERAIFSISNRLASPRLAKLTRRGYTRASPQTNATSVKDARNILVLRPDTNATTRALAVSPGMVRLSDWRVPSYGRVTSIWRCRHAGTPTTTIPPSSRISAAPPIALRIPKTSFPSSNGSTSILICSSLAQSTTVLPNTKSSATWISSVPLAAFMKMTVSSYG